MGCPRVGWAALREFPMDKPKHTAVTILGTGGLDNITMCFTPSHVPLP